MNARWARMGTTTLVFLSDSLYSVTTYPPHCLINNNFPGSQDTGSANFFFYCNWNYLTIQHAFFCYWTPSRAQCGAARTTPTDSPPSNRSTTTTGRATPTHSQPMRSYCMMCSEYRVSLSYLLLIRNSKSPIEQKRHHYNKWSAISLSTGAQLLHDLQWVQSFSL